MKHYQENLIGTAIFILLFSWSLWYWCRPVTKLEMPTSETPQSNPKENPMTSCPAMLLYKDSPVVSCDNLVIDCKPITVGGVTRAICELSS